MNMQRLLLVSDIAIIGFYIFLIIHCENKVQRKCHSLNQTGVAEKHCIHLYLSLFFDLGIHQTKEILESHVFGSQINNGNCEQ